jgi:hypothetical protein
MAEEGEGLIGFEDGEIPRSGEDTVAPAGLSVWERWRDAFVEDLGLRVE